jgi:membrane dipeptidase
MLNQTQIDQRLQDIQQQAIIIDGHSDILIPVNQGKMDLGQRQEVPDPKTWQAPKGLEHHPLLAFGMGAHTIYFGPMGQYDLPRFQEGGLTAQVCAIYLDDNQLGEALRYGLEMTWQLRQAVQQNQGLELVTKAGDLQRLKAAGKCGAILSFEGCEALGADIRFLDLYHALGLRIASLTHTRRNVYADGCYAADQPGGLTALGKDLIRRMNELKIVVDLVHIGETGFWEILEICSAPPILSHSTPTMFPNSDPNADEALPGFPRPRLELPRDRAMMEALAERGGVLGIIWCLQADLEDVVRDIETALEVMGADHIGLGSDLYGLEMAPVGLEEISKVPALTRRLIERGHSDETILKFLGGNYLRVFEQVWGEV